ncbi:MAG TPA: hypothetical protein VMM27_00455, partial [Casimicrobiaceae bacterium]|nr:hypothetical protein [Casimicrobiaceae bacterium]
SRDAAGRATRTLLLTGSAFLVAAFLAAASYPLFPPALIAALGIYAALLWRWPAIWLVAVPAMLPTADLAPWTGWSYVAESDLLILVTIGVLLIRRPPELRDLRFSGAGTAVLTVLVLAELTAVGRGLLAGAPFPGGSDNPFLRPDNALRLAKGLLEALALLPFLRQSVRDGNSAIGRLAIGLTAGLALEALAVVVERGTFLGLFDFSSGYRVVGTFSGMNVGGGFIDDYFVMVLPFIAICAVSRIRFARVASTAVCCLALYGVVVTFSRTAYAATVVGAIALAIGLWALAPRERTRGHGLARILALTSLSVAIAVSAIAFGTEFMHGRLERSVSDLALRERAVLHALSARNPGIATTLFGMGLGTYGRSLWNLDGDLPVPTSFARHRDGDGIYLSITAGTSLYLGQKVPVLPGQRYRLSLTLRSDSGAPLHALLCEKLLLYSLHCRILELGVSKAGEWETRSEIVDSGPIGARVALGFLRRPVELTLYNPTEGTTLDVRNVSLVNADGSQLLANGDFADGMTRWYFTDDDHMGWRIDNQFVMTFFEGGALGLAAFCALLIAAAWGAGRVTRRGELIGPVVIASLAGLSVCCIFDAPLQDPRLAVLVYLVAFLGIALWEKPPQADARP